MNRAHHPVPVRRLPGVGREATPKELQALLKEPVRGDNADPYSHLPKLNGQQVILLFRKEDVEPSRELSHLRQNTRRRVFAHAVYAALALLWVVSGGPQWLIALGLAHTCYLLLLLERSKRRIAFTAVCAPEHEEDINLFLTLYALRGWVSCIRQKEKPHLPQILRWHWDSHVAADESALLRDALETTPFPSSELQKLKTSDFRYVRCPLDD